MAIKNCPNLSNSKPNAIFAAMSLPLRITFEGQDYTYTMLTKKIDRDTAQFKIELNGDELTIARWAAGSWEVLETTVSDQHGLFKAIARNVALRYRLK